MRTASIDFLHPRRVPALGWLLLAIGSLAFLLAAWQFNQRAARRAAHVAVVQAQAQALEHKRRAAMRPAQPTVEERRLLRARDELSRPWIPTFVAIEEATGESVYLLGLSIDPASGRVQIDGHAPSFDHALAYTQMLDADGSLAPARLTSHELVNDPLLGGPVTKFSVITQWSRR